MHWGLTRFERKRIERIVLDHPFFDMHAPLLTKKELRAILSQKPQKTGPQVVAEVKKELGLDAAPVAEQQRTLMDALRDVSFVPSFRRTIVLGVFSLLLVLFMALTVPGRAMAEELYSIVVDFADGMFGAYNSVPLQGHLTSDYTSLPKGIQTIEELAAYLDCPLYSTHDELMQFDYDIVASDTLEIILQYQNKDGNSYTMYQKIYGENTSWGVSAEAEWGPVPIDSPLDIQMYLNHANDGTVYAIGFSEKYTIYIFSQDLSPDALTTVLKGVKKAE